MRYHPEAFGGRSRDDFVKALIAEGITPITQGYVALHYSPAIRKTVQANFNFDPVELDLPHTERAAAQTIWLSQNALLGTRQDMDDILEAVNKIKRAWG